MASIQDAARTLEFYEDQLFQNSNLNYLAIVEEHDDAGEPTNSFTIEAGVSSVDLEKQKRQDAALEMAPAHANFVPLKLNIPTAKPVLERIDMVQPALKLIVTKSNPLAAHSLRSRTRPILGGLSISNYKCKECGSIGEIMKLETEAGLFLISCWHVLCGNKGLLNDAIVQPGVLHDPHIQQNTIAHLSSYRLTDQVDVAFARLINGLPAEPGVSGLGKTKNVIPAANNMLVTKCGCITGISHGKIRSTNASVRLNGYPDGSVIFNKQILTNKMSEGGDSGALLLERGTNNIVGLLIGGNGEDVSIFNHMTRIFSSLDEHTTLRNNQLSENQSLISNLLFHH